MNTQVNPAPLPTTLAVLGPRGGELFGDRPALRSRRPDGSWAEESYADLHRASDEVARGLIALGLKPGDRIATQTKLRPEWTYTLLATAATGVVLSTVLPITVSDEIVHIVSDSGARVLICEDADQLAKTLIARVNLPALERIIVIDPTGVDEDVMSLAELRELGRRTDPGELDERRVAVKPDDLLVILYTSGTTGSKKGCALTHRNYLSAIQSQRDANVGAGYGTLYLTSSTTTMAMITQTMGLTAGMPLAFRKGTDTDAILTEMPEVEPTYLLLVPMVMERIHAVALERLPAQIRPKALEMAKFGARVRSMSEHGDEVSAADLERFEEFERTVFAPVRAMFGPRIKRIQVSGASISAEILEFFAGCGLTVLQGYALTETTGVGVVNRPDANRLGTVGKPVPGVELRISRDGEILIRGGTVFAGYWGHAAVEGAGAIRGGWLHTGDHGQIDDDGFLTLTGRAKDVIKLNNAFGVPPSALESIVRESPLIANFVLYGESKPYLVALVTLDERQVRRWGSEHGLSARVSELLKKTEFLAHLDEEIQRANARVQDYYQAKAYTILERDLSVEAGELTATLKVCRPVVHKHFRDRLEALYS